LAFVSRATRLTHSTTAIFVGFAVTVVVDLIAHIFRGFDRVALGEAILGALAISDAGPPLVAV